MSRPPNEKAAPGIEPRAARSETYTQNNTGPRPLSQFLSRYMEWADLYRARQQGLAPNSEGLGGIWVHLCTVPTPCRAPASLHLAPDKPWQNIQFAALAGLDVGVEFRGSEVSSRVLLSAIHHIKNARPNRLFILDTDRADVAVLKLGDL